MVHLLYIGSTDDNISLVLDDDMKELEVFIEFSALGNHSNQTNYWCDDIKLFIVYDTYREFLRGKHVYRHYLRGI